MFDPLNNLHHILVETIKAVIAFACLPENAYFIDHKYYVLPLNDISIF